MKSSYTSCHVIYLEVGVDVSSFGDVRPIPGFTISTSLQNKSTLNIDNKFLCPTHIVKYNQILGVSMSFVLVDADYPIRGPPKSNFRCEIRIPGVP